MTEILSGDGRWHIQKARNPHSAYPWYVIAPSGWHTPYDSFFECTQHTEPDINWGNDVWAMKP